MEGTEGRQRDEKNCLVCKELTKSTVGRKQMEESRKDVKKS